MFYSFFMRLHCEYFSIFCQQLPKLKPALFVFINHYVSNEMLTNTFINEPFCQIILLIMLYFVIIYFRFFSISQLFFRCAKVMLYYTLWCLLSSDCFIYRSQFTYKYVSMYVYMCVYVHITDWYELNRNLCYFALASLTIIRRSAHSVMAVV